MVGDSLVAVVLLAIDLCVYIAFALQPDFEVPEWYLALPLALALMAPMPFRRRYPVFFAYWVLVVSVPHVAVGLGRIGLGAGFVGCVAVYTLVVYAGRRQAAIYTALTLTASLVQQFIQFPGAWLLNTIVVWLSLALCWVLGEFVGARRAYQAEVEARLHLLETERHQATRIAVAEERSRIARELHDVVAHAVSVIVVHADGASYAIRGNPELAERAVRTISETGRSALNELRRLLAVLRGEDGSDALGEPRVPQPTAADLAELVARMESAGLPVRLELDGDLDLTELPAGVSLGVYRIVQESLTNSLKHAGAGTRARVRICRDGDRVRVEVDDDGGGKARPLGAADGPVVTAPVPGGNGLIGMRERANVYGGTLDAGPSPGGGWQVRAVLPVRLDQ
ncbi:sensor histidine kinase [Prauserella oleivorans]|uniref:histidine kinase n=1 Tax=Prauserella oleivorans TaxID=1478153 RepID=A0ABW5WG66_9PSEU